MSSKKKNSYRSENLTVAFQNVLCLRKMDITGEYILDFNSKSGKSIAIDKSDYDALSEQYDLWKESDDEGGKDE